MAIKMTENRRAVLEGRARGTAYNCMWLWTIPPGEAVTRDVNLLKKRGLVDCQYYSGGKAGCNATEAGLAFLAAHPETEE